MLLCTRSGNLRLQELALFGTIAIVYTVWVRSAPGVGFLFLTKVIVYTVWDLSTPGTGLVWDKSYCLHGLGPFGSSNPALFGKKLLCTRSGSVRLQQRFLQFVTLFKARIFLMTHGGPLHTSRSRRWCEQPGRPLMGRQTITRPLWMNAI